MYVSMYLCMSVNGYEEFLPDRTYISGYNYNRANPYFSASSATVGPMESSHVGPVMNIGGDSNVMLVELLAFQMREALRANQRTEEERRRSYLLHENYRSAISEDRHYYQQNNDINDFVRRLQRK